MRPASIALVSMLLASGILPAAVASARPLPRGNEQFRLGMVRAQIDSAVAARGTEIISNGSAYLVCASADPAIEYVQYAFYQAPHHLDLLWRVTIGYRHNASTADYAAVRESLRRALGEATTDTWQAGDEVAPDDARPVDVSQRAVWVDPSTAVLLGARWTTSPDPNPDRMVVSWTDRRMQRLVELRRKKDKTSASK